MMEKISMEERINIASRLEGVAEPGGICISGDVYNQVQNRISAEYEDLGPRGQKCCKACAGLRRQL